MADKQKENVPIVQEKTSGSLTQKKEAETTPEVDFDPFRRSSRLSRSPVRSRPFTPSSDPSPLSETLPEQGSEKTTSPYEAVIALARQEEEDLLTKCFDTLSQMKSATRRQRNVNQDVKTGITKLESYLNHILHLRKSWKSCEKTLVSSSTQTSPRQQTSQSSTAASSKRAASSPAEPVTEKKKKVDGNKPEEWVTVAKRKGKQKNPPQQSVVQPGDETTKKPKKKRASKQRPDALLIKPTSGKTYADVLGEIRQKVKPEEKGAVIKSLRKTRAGDLLVELGDSSGTKAEFGADLQSILGANASVRILEPKSTLEVRDLDELTTEEEVSTAVKSVLGEPSEMKIFVSKANSRGQKMAILTLGARDGRKLLAEGLIKVGWVRCRVREKLVAPRCYKCLGFNHIANRCKGPDRSNMCYKCGGQNHRANVCSSAESCVLCTEAGLKNDAIKHAAGSSRCAAYKQALHKIRQSTQK